MTSNIKVFTTFPLLPELRGSCMVKFALGHRILRAGLGFGKIQLLMLKKLRRVLGKLRL